MATDEYQDELLADFQQTYHLDLWGIDWDALDDGSAAHIAALAYQLPKDSRTKSAIAPAAAYGVDVLLLREIEHNQRMWHWANTKEAKNEETRPEPITLTGEEEAYRAMAESERQNAIEVASILGINI